MEKLQQFIKNSSSYFYIIASITLIIFILNFIDFFDWLRQLIHVLKPLWIGGILAFFIQPLISNKKDVSLVKIIFIYLLFLFSFLFLFALFFYLLIQNIPSFIKIFNDYYPNIERFIQENRILNHIESPPIKDILLNGYEWLFPFVRGFIQFITTFIFSVLISFFISLESSFIHNEFKKYIKNYEQILHLYDIFSKILRQYIYSTSLDILYIIMSTSFILIFFKTPYAILLAILLSVFNLFPYVGALLGSVLLVFIHFVLVGENTIWLIIVIFINSQIESNIIHAWICNKTMKVHPLFLFVALLINEFLFGIIGIILSPIVASILQMILTTYREYLNQKNVGGWEKISES